MTAEARQIDRAGWGHGQWDGEPDRVEFRTKAGFPALITRTEFGHLCGYVAVPPGHPFHGKDYSTEYEKDAEGENDYARPLPNQVGTLDVHGGITYASACSGHICHVPEPGEPDDVWWLGFDCDHGCDASPTRNLGDVLWRSNGIYRTVAYVREQCEALAEQIAMYAVSAVSEERLFAPHEQHDHHFWAEFLGTEGAYLCEDCPDQIIRCECGAYAETFANRDGLKYFCGEYTCGLAFAKAQVATAEANLAAAKARLDASEKRTDRERPQSHCMRDPSVVGCCAGPGRCSCECSTCEDPR